MDILSIFYSVSEISQQSQSPLLDGWLCLVSMNDKIPPQLLHSLIFILLSPTHLTKNEWRLLHINITIANRSPCHLHGLTSSSWIDRYTERHLIPTDQLTTGCDTATGVYNLLADL